MTWSLMSRDSFKNHWQKKLMMMSLFKSLRFPRLRKTKEKFPFPCPQHHKRISLNFTSKIESTSIGAVSSVLKQDGTILLLAQCFIWDQLKCLRCVFNAFPYLKMGLLHNSTIWFCSTQATEAFLVSKTKNKKRDAGAHRWREN